MLELNSLQAIFLGSMIIGIVEAISRVRARDWWAFGTIASSAIVGAIFGQAEFYDMTVLQGLSAGIGASGLVTLLTVRRDSASPSSFFTGVKRR